MRKEMILTMALLGLVLRPFTVNAEAPSALEAVQETGAEAPHEIMKEEPPAVQDPVIPPVPPPNEIAPVEIQNQSPPQDKITEGFSKEELAEAGLTAEEPQEGATRPPLGWVFGLRAGIAIPTQKVIQDFGNSTSIGPLVNVEALYAAREWIRVGLMVEWHRHSIKMWGPEFGTLNTVSLLPTVEFRPTRDFVEDHGLLVVPYTSLGLGLNVNSLSKGSGLSSGSTVSFDNTLAFRVAGGIDFPIAQNVSLNGELAWNRNSGDYQLNTSNGSFNASTLNLLFGLRAEF